MEVAIYARYSSENQRDASIADQIRVCREFAKRQGRKVDREYSDHAMSGATLMRPGFQAMMAVALRRSTSSSPSRSIASAAIRKTPPGSSSASPLPA